MIDLKLIRENADFVRKNYEKRQDEKLIISLDKIQETDRRWRAAKYELDQLISQKNNISADINRLRKEGKDINAKLAEMKSLPSKVVEKQKEEAELHTELTRGLMRLPNLLDESVPYGKDGTQNPVVRTVGKATKPKHELLPHAEFAEKLGIADFERSAKISGGGHYFLLGDLALLNQALIRYAVESLVEKDYLFVEPPLMLKREAYEGVTDLSDFENVMYKIEGEDQYLIATSEHPLCAMWKDDVIEESKLPIRLVGLSPCFRKGIGAHGIDERGLFRRHMFFKVEQVIICKPEDSQKLHEELIANSEELFKGLGIPYHVINICTGDIGTVAAKKYDIEAWMPRTQEYKEVVSGSNCTDYQARRLNIRYGKEGGKKELCHTLNCTGIATSRALVAILENHQQSDGTLLVPEALQKYMGKKKRIGP